MNSTQQSQYKKDLETLLNRYKVKESQMSNNKLASAGDLKQLQTEMARIFELLNQIDPQKP